MSETRPEPENAVARALGTRLADGRSLGFDAFMETALYHEPGGYYASGGGSRGTGRGGDFFTSVSVGPCFGFLLAHLVREIWENLDRPDGFTLVEAGANDGQLTADITAAMATLEPALAATLRTVLVERSAALRERIAGRLPDAAVYATIEDVPPDRTGCLIANELLDALPVALVRLEDGTWKERRVTQDAGGGFTFVSEPVSSDELAAATARLGTAFPDGYTTEIALAAPRWLQAAAPVLARGAFFFFDYGFTRDEYFSPLRTEGTLQSYQHHQAGHPPLESPGQQDLTAHVEFSSLMETAKSLGLTVAGFDDQHHTLVRLATPWLQSLEADPTAFRAAAATLRQFQTLTHPALMGRAFKALALTRALPGTLRAFPRTPTVAPPPGPP